jgi:serine protease Do
VPHPVAANDEVERPRPDVNRTVKVADDDGIAPGIEPGHRDLRPEVGADDGADLGVLSAGMARPCGQRNAEVGVNEAVDRHGDPVAKHPAQHPVAMIAGGETVAVGEKERSPLRGDADRVGEGVESDFPLKEGTGPPVVIAAQEEDGEAGARQGLESGQDGEAARGNGVAILEPEVEEIAHEDEGGGLPRDLLEEFEESPLLLPFALRGGRADMGVADEVDGPPGAARVVGKLHRPLIPDGRPATNAARASCTPRQGFYDDAGGIRFRGRKSPGEVDDMTRTLKRRPAFRAAGFLAGGTLLAGLVLGILFSSALEWPGAGRADQNRGGRGSATPGRQSLAPPAEGADPPAGEFPLKSPFVAVARQVVPAVVYVDAARRMPHPPIPDDRIHGDVLRRLFPDDGRDEIVMPSSGSGFIFDDEGYILTNNHVVAGASDITVHLSDGRNFAGEIIGSDDKTDVAVLRIRPRDGEAPLPVVRLGDSDAVEVGDWAIAIGNPLGQLEGSVTVGVISAKGRSDLDIVGGGPDYQDFLQTDASINFGNSGGPLVNTRGEVIGINTAINPTGQGLGFAIPVNMARNVSAQLIATGRVTRGYMGVVPQQLTAELAEGLGLATYRGILVAHVESGGPADRAGLRVKDVITAIDGVEVLEVNRFRRLVAEAPVGEDLTLRVLRDGQAQIRRVSLAERPDEAAAVPPRRELPADDRPAEWFGARLEPMSRDLAEQFEVDFMPGLAVTAIEAGSPADDAGLIEGDIVLELNEKPVRTLDDWGRIMEAARGRTRPLVLLVSRNGVATYVALRGGSR